MTLQKRKKIYHHPVERISKGCVTHRDLAVYIKKYLNSKEELWKLTYFTMQQNNLQKIL
jgi:hypothetical protein